jgi:hypothetical protein
MLPTNTTLEGGFVDISAEISSLGSRSMERETVLVMKGCGTGAGRSKGVFRVSKEGDVAEAGYARE